MAAAVDEQVLMRAIEAVSFVMDDVRLFLDTHPQDADALAYYNKARGERDALVAQYTAAYGPLNFYQAGGSTQWNWVQGPWPWQIER